MAEVGSAFVTIVPTLKGSGSKIQSELDGAVGPAADKSGQKAGKRFGSRMGSALKSGVAAGIGAAAGAGAVKLIKDSIGEAREAQKVAAVTNQIIKATGGAANVSAAGVERLATSISNKTGIDDEAVQTGANLLLTFKNVRNEVGKGNRIFNQATKAAVDLSAAGFGSIDSASVMLGKALNDPIKGMTALGRAGVTFTQEQKDQAEQLVKNGDLLGAQKIILGEVQSQVGGVAAASGTAGEKLGTAFNNFKEAIGTALLPYIDMALAKITPLFAKFTENKPLLLTVAAIVGGVLVGAFVALAVAVIGATWPFLLAGAAIGLLVAGFIYAYKHSETFRNIVRALGGQALITGAMFLTMGAKVVRAIGSMLGALGKIKSDKFQWARDGSKALQGVATKLEAGAAKAHAFGKNLQQPTKDTNRFGDSIKKVPASKKVGVSVSSLTKPIKDSSTLTSNLKKVPPRTTARLSTEGFPDGIDAAKQMRAAVLDVPERRNTHYTWSGSSKEGSSEGRQPTAAGGIFHGATTRLIGEAGAEAVVPLDRPLNMVDPSVRWLAAYAQGKTDLASMRPMNLDGADIGGSSSSGSSGPLPVVVTNLDGFDRRSARVADGQIAAERSLAGTIGRQH